MQQLVDNRYRIVQPLGNGGMAEVYLAHDAILDRDVALKVMSGRYASDEEFVERFKREAQSAAALSHPNIVSIFDRGASEDGTYYIAMEYLPGGTLKDRITKRGALPPRTATAVTLQIAEALRAAHERGVIHRDIKPHNILITESGDVKVTDFGIARAASSSTMTKTGSILGTAHYISPEQAMGEPVGPSSDLYSLGVVLYEMLTGELPFDADTPLGIAMKHVNGHLRPPKEVNPRIPEGINAITVRLLAKDPLDRYASDAELIEDLERVLAGLEPSDATTEMMTRVMPATSTTMVGPPPPRARSDAKRRRALPVFLSLLALLLLGSLAYGGYPLLQEEPVPRIEVPDLVGMTREEAEIEFGDDFDIEVGNQVEGEKPVGTILSQDPKGGKAEKGSEISVKVVGTQVADVPGVVGQGRDAAEQALDEVGFEVRVEEEESSFEEQGLVTNQNPAGGSTQEVGSDVTITIGAGPSTVEVPDLSGNNPDQAAVLLEQAGLVLGAQNEVYDDDPATEGTVISQDPQPSSEAEPGTSVDITVSLGLEPVIVPQVYGMDLATARQTVANAGFYYDVFKVEPTGDEPAGTALYTDPEAGTELDPGLTVVIYYSSGPPPEPTPEPTAEPNPAEDAEAREEAREEAQQRREDAREARQDSRATANTNANNGNGDSGGGDSGGGDSGNGNND